MATIDWLLVILLSLLVFQDFAKCDDSSEEDSHYTAEKLEKLIKDEILTYIKLINEASDDELKSLLLIHGADSDELGKEYSFDISDEGSKKISQLSTLLNNADGNSVTYDKTEPTKNSEISKNGIVDGTAVNLPSSFEIRSRSQPSLSRNYNDDFERMAAMGSTRYPYRNNPQIMRSYPLTGYGRIGDGPYSRQFYSNPATYSMPQFGAGNIMYGSMPYFVGGRQPYWGNGLSNYNFVKYPETAVFAGGPGNAQFMKDFQPSNTVLKDQNVETVPPKKKKIENEIAMKNPLEYGSGCNSAKKGMPEFTRRPKFTGENGELPGVQQMRSPGDKDGLSATRLQNIGLDNGMITMQFQDTTNDDGRGIIRMQSQGGDSGFPNMKLQSMNGDGGLKLMELQNQNNDGGLTGIKMLSMDGDGGLNVMKTQNQISDVGLPGMKVQNLGGDEGLNVMKMANMNGDGGLKLMELQNQSNDGGLPGIKMLSMGGDGGLNVMKMQNQISDAGIPCMKVQNLGGDGGLNVMKMQSMNGDGGLKLMELQNQNNDGGLPGIKMQSMGGDGGLNVMKMQSQIGDVGLSGLKVQNLGGDDGIPNIKLLNSISDGESPLFKTQINDSDGSISVMKMQNVRDDGLQTEAKIQNFLNAGTGNILTEDGNVGAIKTNEFRENVGNLVTGNTENGSGNKNRKYKVLIVNSNSNLPDGIKLSDLQKQSISAQGLNGINSGITSNLSSFPSSNGVQQIMTNNSGFPQSTLLMDSKSQISPMSTSFGTSFQTNMATETGGYTNEIKDSRTRDSNKQYPSEMNGRKIIKVIPLQSY